MSNYAAFKRVFSTTKTNVLLSTIKNSEARHGRYSRSGNDAAAAVEIDRIQAAADVLDERGYYNDKPAQRFAKAGFSMPKGAIMAAAAVLGLVLLS